MPRFVILEHDHPHLHWDLMLESGDALRTWRLAEPPKMGSTIEATMLGDHRMAYLDYEGPVSGDRGMVKRWEVGTFEWRSQSTGEITVELRGTICVGVARLLLVQTDEWTFSMESDL